MSENQREGVLVAQPLCRLSDAQVRLVQRRPNGLAGQTVTLMIGDDRFQAELGLLGAHNATNALAATAAAQDPGQDLRQLARQARDSVVLLNVFAPGGRAVGTGTGFFVEGGRLVTNHHVVDRAHRVAAMLASEETLEVTGVAAADETNDLAILEIAAGSYPTLILADAAVEPGEGQQGQPAQQDHRHRGDHQPVEQADHGVPSGIPRIDPI